MRTIANVSILTAFLAGCATITPLDPPVRPAEISSILYSDLSKQEMLARLAPYVKVGDKLKHFEKKTGLDAGLCLVGGPGVTMCSSSVSGLDLTMDRFGVIRVIRRKERQVDGRKFEAMSVSAGVMEMDGYYRAYEN
ncbi:hypothetical protein [Arenimonas sp.]|uniref:hypothetical protein n=1 Tax=Arenimonas sp. TaxID=1872635 RepID=UPI0039E71B72